MDKNEELLNKYITKISHVGDELALAAAQVCTEYDGVHRLRYALSEWYNLRAGIHGKLAPTDSKQLNSKDGGKE